MRMLLEREAVEEGCEAARERYGAMEVREATVGFAYELSGFVASCVDRGMSLSGTMKAVGDLMASVERMNEETGDEG